MNLGTHDFHEARYYRDGGYSLSDRLSDCFGDRIDLEVEILEFITELIHDCWDLLLGYCKYDKKFQKRLAEKSTIVKRKIRKIKLPKK